MINFFKLLELQGFCTIPLVNPYSSYCKSIKYLSVNISLTLTSIFLCVSIAFLSFGLVDPQLLTFATGTCLAVFGICQICIYLQYPELLEYNKS